MEAYSADAFFIMDAILDRRLHLRQQRTHNIDITPLLHTHIADTHTQKQGTCAVMEDRKQTNTWTANVEKKNPARPREMTTKENEWRRKMANTQDRQREEIESVKERE